MKKNDDELRRAAHHVAHDIRMLGRAFDRLQADAFAYTAWFIHCRSVMGFFQVKGHSNDILVSTFLPWSTWENIVQNIHEPDGYQETRNAVNKLAAHLAFDRLKYEKGGSHEDQGRPREDITNYLLALARLFVDALPPERQAWFGGIWR